MISIARATIILHHVINFHTKQFDELETLGFTGFAVGFSGRFSQIIGTTTTLKLFTPQFLNYLYGMIVAGRLSIRTTRQ